MRWTLEWSSCRSRTSTGRRRSTPTGWASTSTTTRGRRRHADRAAHAAGVGMLDRDRRGRRRRHAARLVKGLQLVVADVRAAREQLLERGVEVGEVQVLARTRGRSPTRSTTSASSSSATRTATPGRAADLRARQAAPRRTCPARAPGGAPGCRGPRFGQPRHLKPAGADCGRRGASASRGRSRSAVESGWPDMAGVVVPWPQSRRNDTRLASS